MSFPPSKLGDDYNYRVAAYLKVKGIPELGPYYDLKISDIKTDPPQFSSSVTSFKVPVSFDAIASTARWDILMECKHMIEPRPISPTDEKWMEAMAEFYSEPLRSLEFKDVKYFFITNSDTTALSKELKALRISSDSELSAFGERIKRTALKKWKKAVAQTIPVQSVRECLDNVRIFTIEDSKLDAVSEDPEYSKVYREMTGSLGEKLPDLPRNLPSSVRILLTYMGMKNSFVIRKWAGSSISISKRLVRWAVANAGRPIETMVEVNFSELPQGDHLGLRKSNEFSMEQVASGLTASINEEIAESSKRQVTVFIVSPMNRKLYLVNPVWLVDTSALFRDARYRFNLAKMQEELRLPIGGLLLQLTIQQAFKSRNGVNLDSSYFLC